MEEGLAIQHVDFVLAPALVMPAVPASSWQVCLESVSRLETPLLFTVSAHVAEV